MHMPWRDRRGRFLPIKAVTLGLCFVPGVVYAIGAVTGALGGRVLNELIHASGLWSVRIMLIALAVTPAARLLEWPRVLLVRRMIGLAALAYALIHFGLYIVDQKFALLVVIEEILKRVYLTIGCVAVIGLIALGVTSTDGFMRRMGPWWKRLHRLAYPITILGLLHYFMQSKANVSQPVFVAGLYLWLMLWRALPDAWRKPAAVYPAMALVVGLATAGVEFAWYATATRIDPWRVLAANESLALFPRPAHWVAIAGLGVLTAVILRRTILRPVSVSRSSGPIPARTGRASSGTPPNPPGSSA